MEHEGDEVVVVRMDRPTVLRILDLVGVFVFAASGALAGLHAHLDLFGVVVLASVTAVGGGTIRDLLLDRHPIFWVKDTAPLVVVLSAALVTVLWVKSIPVPSGALLVADALGLALFAMSGAQLAEASRHSFLVVVLAGTLSGAGGGVIRDVLTAQVPLILRSDIYATAAVAGLVAYRLIRHAGVRETVAFTLGLAIIVSIRLAAIHWDLSLPAL